MITLNEIKQRAEIMEGTPGAISLETLLLLRSLELAARWYLSEIHGEHWRIQDVPDKEVEDLVNTWLYEAGK